MKQNDIRCDVAWVGLNKVRRAIDNRLNVFYDEFEIKKTRYVDLRDDLRYVAASKAEFIRRDYGEELSELNFVREGMAEHKFAIDYIERVLLKEIQRKLDIIELQYESRAKRKKIMDSWDEEQKKQYKSDLKELFKMAKEIIDYIPEANDMEEEDGAAETEDNISVQ